MSCHKSRFCQSGFTSFVDLIFANILFFVKQSKASSSDPKISKQFTFPWKQLTKQFLVLNPFAFVFSLIYFKVVSIGVFLSHFCSFTYNGVWSIYCVKTGMFLVVSIGAILTFKVIFTPLKYIPTVPPLSSYVINIIKESIDI